MSNEPVAWIEHGLVEAPDGLVWERGTVGHYTPLYTHPVNDTALLRQCMAALAYYHSAEDYYPTPASEALAALRERLKEST